MDINRKRISNLMTKTYNYRVEILRVHETEIRINAALFYRADAAVKGLIHKRMELKELFEHDLILG